MSIDSDKKRNFLEKVGFWCLFLTIFFIAFPRTWSLYSLGVFLTVGASLWILNFEKEFHLFIKAWILILPPVFYFLLNLISAVLQENSFDIIQTRLMFFLIPIFGFPVFFSDYSRSRISILLKGFTIGILLVSIFLIIKVLLKLINTYPGDISLQNTYPGDFPFFPWLNDRQLDYSSGGFSIFEHPTYLSLKVNWVLILLIFFDWNSGYNWKHKVLFSLILTLTIFLLASKAGLFLWFVLILSFLIRKIRLSQNRIIYIILIPAFIFMTIFSFMKITRMESFITTIKTEIISRKTGWKDIGPRSREWYSAIQIIKEKPLFGAGISKANDEMVEVYLKNDFKEEAAYRYNAHNQFLEVQMTFGIAGTISLLLLLFVPFFFEKQISQFNLLKVFITIYLFSLSFESMFNRQWGIMFFLLFYYMLITPPDEPESNMVK